MSPVQNPSAPSPIAASQFDAREVLTALPDIPYDDDPSHSAELALARRKLCERAAGHELPHLAGLPTKPSEVANNIENLFGFIQVPVGVAGPLRVDTSDGVCEVYVPMATTEGALVASYARGMKLLGLAGGTRARVISEGLSLHPMLIYRTAQDAIAATAVVQDSLAKYRELTLTTTRHGRLLNVVPEVLGRRLVLRLVFHTADSIGINMACLAADLITSDIAKRTDATNRYVHGEVLEKRASSRSLAQGRGRSVIAEAVVSKEVLMDLTRATPQGMCELFYSQVIGYAHSGTHVLTLQAANGLAAVMLACGQDVAYLPECAAGFLDLSVMASGSLNASVTLPSLLVGTIGGGAMQGTAAECLSILGCHGTGTANRFAEILAATVLAGELSLLAALCTQEFVLAHEKHGRNRPAEPQT